MRRQILLSSPAGADPVRSRKRGEAAGRFARESPGG